MQLTSKPHSAPVKLQFPQSPIASPAFMRTSVPPTNRLLAHAPKCSRCKRPMKVRTLLPGRKVDDVAYRCEECGAEVVRPVPRPS